MSDSTEWCQHWKSWSNSLYIWFDLQVLGEIRLRLNRSSNSRTKRRAASIEDAKDRLRNTSLRRKQTTTHWLTLKRKPYIPSPNRLSPINHSWQWLDKIVRGYIHRVSTRVLLHEYLYMRRILCSKEIILFLSFCDFFLNFGGVCVWTTNIWLSRHQPCKKCKSCESKIIAPRTIFPFS